MTFCPTDAVIVSAQAVLQKNSEAIKASKLEKKRAEIIFMGSFL